ncbi:MAG TPA: type IV pilin protein, partial [Methylotenera sp.]|nr:type IV pilin protein [Methylotenera sp.]
YITRSKRADGKAALLALQLKQERFRAINPTYANSASLGLPSLSPDTHYTISVSSATATTYSLIAAPEASQNDPECATLIINQDGVKDATGTATDPIQTCWQR